MISLPCNYLFVALAKTSFSAAVGFLFAALTSWLFDFVNVFVRFAFLDLIR